MSLRKDASDDEASGSESDFSEMDEEAPIPDIAGLSISGEESIDEASSVKIEQVDSQINIQDSSNVLGEKQSYQGAVVDTEPPLQSQSRCIDEEQVYSPAEEKELPTVEPLPMGADLSEPEAQFKSVNQACQNSEFPSDEESPQGGDNTQEGPGKQARALEPYDVPSFGHHFFCHDDRYVQSNRGRGRGRSSHLWDKEPLWGHDGYHELIKNDTAPPRMVEDADGRSQHESHRDRRGDGSGRRRRGAGPRGDAAASHATHDDRGHYSSSSTPPRATPDAVSFETHRTGRSSRQSSSRGRSQATTSQVEVEEQFPRSSRRGLQDQEDRQAPVHEWSRPRHHDSHARQKSETASGRSSANSWSNAEPWAPSGRQGASSKPTFYGREVSSPQVRQSDAHDARDRAHGGASDAHSSQQPVRGQTENISGSRRYLAGRSENQGGGVSMATGQSVKGENTLVMQTMVPIQASMHEHAQAIHLNPNAPGFLPLGTEQRAAMGSQLQSHPNATQPGATGSQPHQAVPLSLQDHSTAPQRYLSASTAKGMLLRSELQSLISMPQATAPATQPNFMQGQLFYGPTAVTTDVDGNAAFMAANTVQFAQPAGFGNAQQISVAPVGIAAHQPSPEMFVHVPAFETQFAPPASYVAHISGSVGEN